MQLKQMQSFVLIVNRLYVRSCDTILLMCENCSTQKAMKSLMADHCLELPMVGLHNMKVALFYFKGQAGCCPL